MAIIRPRLTDHYGILVPQEEIDFAIPLLDDDIPLYVDPFLLWRSPSMQDTSLHTAMIAAFNGIGRMAKGPNRAEAQRIVVSLSECIEAGLGQALNKKGRRISLTKADEVLELFNAIPDIKSQGLQHIETIHLLVDDIAKDRLSDFACSLLKSFLIDYTIDQCVRIGIPRERVHLEEIYDSTAQRLISEVVELPVNPETRLPLLFIPKRWLRFVPWINYDSYYDGSFVKLPPGTAPQNCRRAEVLNFNRHNYGLVQQYLQERERSGRDCKNDPLFKQLPVTAAKIKWSAIKRLPTGTTNGSDKKYESYVEQLLATLLYPQLDFAQGQSRTSSGALIRDLIFYNNRRVDFLDEIYQKYNSYQIVFEMKNVKSVEPEHVSQLNRYLADHLGRFGVIVTRNPLPKNVAKSLIDLWSGQRKCIIALTDDDLQTMVTVFESKQRSPIEVLKRAYIEFTRNCPS